MDISSWWWLAFFLVFALGWWVSRYDMRSLLQQKNALPKQYFIGLQHLLNQQPDQAIDAFIEVAKLDPHTIDLHLALGQMFRRRGEFGRAIRIHSYLMERADLADAQRLQAHADLAQDYYKAGMYDRAELLFKHLLQSTHHAMAAQYLIKIANWEQDWAKAESWTAYLPQNQQDKLKNHFILNQLEGTSIQANGNDSLDIDQLLQALPNPHHPRALLYKIQRHLQHASDEKPSMHEDKALQMMTELLQESPICAPSILALLQKISTSAQARFWQNVEQQMPLKAWPALLVQAFFTRHLQAKHGMALDDEVRGKITQLMQEATAYPALNAYAIFYQMREQEKSADNASPSAEDKIFWQQLHKILQQRQTQYICQDCGFKARKFSWSCAGCREWDTLSEHQQAFDF